MMVREVLYLFGFSYLYNVYMASVNWQLTSWSQVSDFIIVYLKVCVSPA